MSEEANKPKDDNEIPTISPIITSSRMIFIDLEYQDESDDDIFYLIQDAIVEDEEDETYEIIEEIQNEGDEEKDVVIYLGNESIWKFSSDPVRFEAVDKKATTRWKLYITNINDSNTKNVDSKIGNLSSTIHRISEGKVESTDENEPILGIGRATEPNNWGGGGPGGLPIPPSITDVVDSDGKNFLDETSPLYIDLGDILNGLRDTNGGEKTLVAILDTSPLTLNEQIWEQATQEYENNILLKSLASVLKIVNVLDSFDEGLVNEDANKAGVQSYPMISHGIFVAGIIHSIAPNADIKLYRSISSIGLTAANPVQDGLKEIVENHVADSSDKVLVVNCSLNMGLEKTPSLYSEDHAESWWRKHMNKIHPIVVAGAAGNERTYLQTHDHPPYPLKPAAYAKVLGVTSLKKKAAANWKRSSYANWAGNFIHDVNSNNDNATGKEYRRGIATYAGDLTQIFDDDGEPLSLRITNPLDSLLGLYIQHFNLPYFPPEYSIMNKHGLARWCGTSFATAIVSGVLALIASDRKCKGLSIDRESLITDLLENHCHTNLSESYDGVNVNRERILEVRQGPVN